MYLSAIDIMGESLKIKEIVNQLKKVIDPELHIDIVSVGLIYNIHLNNQNELILDMTLTTPGCPLRDYFESETETVLSDLEFLQDVKINIIFDPHWSLEMMDEEMKLKMFKSLSR